jgi:hypothetical protein
MRNSRRRSTVHDLTSLRLHPDGSKVANSASNLQLRKARNATKDVRGNWIAQDAGGSGRVKTRWSVIKDQAAKAASKDEGEVREDSGNQAEAGPSSPVFDKGKGKATQAEDEDDDDEDFIPKDARAKKRRVFANDFEFLGSPAGCASVSHVQSLPAVAFQDSDRNPSKYATLSQPSSVSPLRLRAHISLNIVHRIYSSAYITSLAHTIPRRGSSGTQVENTEGRRNAENWQG